MIVLMIVSFFCGVSGALLIYHKGFQAGFTDQPNQRSSHTKPTPRGGALGVVLAFIIASLWYDLDTVFVLPVLAVSLSGLADDRMELSAGVRLLIQISAGCVLVYGLDFWYSPIWILMFWVFFITGTANCTNFMDGINGIAALTGIAAFFLLAFYLQLTGRLDDYTRVSLCVAVALMGFLPFNFPRARVFMGDTGSLLIGFMFGGLVCRFSGSLHEFFILASFFFPFYSDELTTMAVRIKKGENLLTAHRRHLYQILVNEAGFSHFRVAVLYVVIQLFVGLSVLLLHKMDTMWIVLFLVLCFILFSTCSVFVRQKYYEA